MAGIVSQTFLVSDDLNSFEEYWSGILQNVPLLGFVWCLLMIRLGSISFFMNVLVSLGASFVKWRMKKRVSYLYQGNVA